MDNSLYMGQPSNFGINSQPSQMNNFINNSNSYQRPKMVQQALDTGKMSPQQFAELRRIANAMTGMSL